MASRPQRRKEGRPSGAVPSVIVGTLVAYLSRSAPVRVDLKGIRLIAATLEVSTKNVERAVDTLCWGGLAAVEDHVLHLLPIRGPLRPPLSNGKAVAL